LNLIKLHLTNLTTHNTANGGGDDCIDIANPINCLLRFCNTVKTLVSTFTRTLSTVITSCQLLVTDVQELKSYAQFYLEKVPKNIDPQTKNRMQAAKALNDMFFGLPYNSDTQLNRYRDKGGQQKNNNICTQKF
jgi:hypothetical protein